MKKILSILLIGVLVIGLTGCGGSGSNNAASDITKAYNDCLSQNDKSTCDMNWTFQNYLEGYTSYRLINTSKNEFTIEPKEPVSQFTYGASRDGICAYNYALFYNVETNTYYSVKLECKDHNDSPTFAEAKNLSSGKVDKLPDNERPNKEETKNDDNKTNNEVNNSETSTNTNTNSETTNGLKVGNYVMKYGTYKGDAAASGIDLVIKEDGTCTYEGKNCTYTLGTFDFAQDISSKGHPKDCIVIKTDYTYHFYPENDTTFTDGGINSFIYSGK